jgi:membrane fusion protein (multidrug efflux system)
MRHKGILLLVVSISALALIYLVMKKPKPETGRFPETNTIPVSVAIAQKQKLMTTTVLTGALKSGSEVIVVSETGGTVKEIFVQVGQPVSAATTLARVNDETLQSRYTAAQIQYQKAFQKYEQSKILFQQNSIRAAKLEKARSGMQAAEERYNMAKLQLEKTQIRSPVSGRLHSLYITTGTRIKPGTMIATITDSCALSIQVDVAEQDAFNLKTGDLIEITTEMYPDHKFTSRVNKIAAKAAAAHKHAVEFIVLTSDQYPLHEGMTAQVLLTSLTPDDALIVPRLALIGSIKKASVFRIKRGVANLRTIVIGRQSNDFLEVLNGVSRGDTVVVNGQANLVNGSRVNIIN